MFKGGVIRIRRKIKGNGWSVKNHSRDLDYLFSLQKKREKKEE